MHIISKLELLEKKIQSLLEENFEYQEKIANFEQILKEQKAQLERCENQKNDLKQQVEQCAIGNAFAGKANQNEEAKAKIEGLIKEINLCIATLKE